jgi:predicted nucleotidyltransferase
MIQQSENTLAAIGEVVRATLPAAQILLFGSHARGQAAPDSDYDILIIVDRPLDIHRKLALRTHIRKQLLERGIRCDILIQSEQEIQRKKELPGHIVRSALREGVRL